MEVDYEPFHPKAITPQTPDHEFLEKQKRTVELLLKMQTLLKSSWSKDTSGQPRDWKQSCPEIGQCLPTALTVQDYFGGEIEWVSLVFTPKDTKELGGGFGQHFLNVIDGIKVDLTSGQFSYTNAQDNIKIFNRSDRHETYGTAREWAKLKPERWQQYLLLKKKFEEQNPDFVRSLIDHNI